METSHLERPDSFQFKDQGANSRAPVHLILNRGPFVRERPDVLGRDCLDTEVSSHETATNKRAGQGGEEKRRGDDGVSQLAPFGGLRRGEPPGARWRLRLFPESITHIPRSI